MRNSIIKLLGALTLATTPVVSLVACGVDSEVVSTWMERITEVKVSIKENATADTKKKAAEMQIKKELKVLGIKPKFKWTDDIEKVTITYSLNKKNNEKEITIKYETLSKDDRKEETETDKAIKALKDSLDAKVAAVADLSDDSKVKEAANQAVKTALANEAENVNITASKPEGDTTKKTVSVEVKAKEDKGKETKTITVTVTAS